MLILSVRDLIVLPVRTVGVKYVTNHSSLWKKRLEWAVLLGWGWWEGVGDRSNFPGHRLHR